MKQQLKLMALFCLLSIGAIGFIAFNFGSLHALDNQNVHEESTVTVESVVDLMVEPWQQLVIIQGDNVVYRGSASDNNYNTYKVLEIANTEDGYNNDSITLIIE